MAWLPRLTPPALPRALARSLVLALLLVLGAGPLRAEAPDAPAQAPDAAAAQFYRWYLGRLTANADPLRDDAATMARLVSPALLREIDRRQHSAEGLEADPFIQAQDYLDDWVHQVRTGPPRAQAGRATVLVELGTATPPWRLTVTLARERGAWLIRQVVRAR